MDNTEATTKIVKAIIAGLGGYGTGALGDMGQSAAALYKTIHAAVVAANDATINR